MSSADVSGKSLLKNLRSITDDEAGTAISNAGYLVCQRFSDMIWIAETFAETLQRLTGEDSVVVINLVVA